MTATLLRTTTTPAGLHALARAGLLRELESPRQVFSNITPNWYASIMGTGIVGVAAAGLPVQFTGLRAFGTVLWGAAAVLLIALTAATVAHWITHPTRARSHHRDPIMVHFYGAPPMALLTVGAGALLLGRDVFGLRAAVDIDWVLWFAGTITGLSAAVIVPYLQFTRHDGLTARSAFGGWLMPIVPPMVSASTGALLIPHAPAGQARLTLLMACYAMFGVALIASLIVIALIWYRLAIHAVDEPRMVPTLWIVLGPLGQSITAANLLGGVAAQAMPRPYSTAMQAFGVIYGVPVWGFALLWACLAGAVTIRTVRAGMPFSLTWWSFTFPVGTCVTGTSGLALHTGADLFHYAAAILYVGLVVAWIAVAARTARASLRGTLFVPPAPQPIRQD